MDWALIPFLPELLRGAYVTLRLTVISGVLSAVVALIAGLGRLTPSRTVRIVAGLYVEVFRGTSGVVQLFFAFFALPLVGVDLTPMTAGVLALGLNIGAYGAEVVRGAVQALPTGQVEAAIALNMSFLTRLRHVILPQAVVTMVPPFGNLTIELLKGTALVSLITINELTFAAQLIRSRIGRTAEVFAVVLLMYFLMSQVIAMGFRRLERRVDYRRRTQDAAPQAVDEDGTTPTLEAVA